MAGFDLTSNPRSRFRTPLLLGTAAWCASLLAVLAALAVYGRPSDPEAPNPAQMLPVAVADSIPAAAHHQRTTGLRVEFWAHPRCPCTRASADACSELVDALRRAGATVQPVAIVRTPALGSNAAADAWSDTPVTRRLRSIAGLIIVEDPGGTMSAAAAIVNSGHVRVHAADGASLLFHGGLTPSRGHAADPARIGRMAAALARGETLPSSGVAGCRLNAAPDPGPSGLPAGGPTDSQVDRRTDVSSRSSTGSSTGSPAGRSTGRSAGNSTGSPTGSPTGRWTDVPAGTPAHHAIGPLSQGFAR
ncbi:MAG: hypothetical protein AB8G96_11270 [Phycisphaerales bacterium]